MHRSTYAEIKDCMCMKNTRRIDRKNSKGSPSQPDIAEVPLMPSLDHEIGLGVRLSMGPA